MDAQSPSKDDPDDARSRAALVDRLHRAPGGLDPGREAEIRRLLDHPLVNPQSLIAPGWSLLIQAERIPLTPEAIAEWLEGDAFAQALLHAGFVTTLSVEKRLGELRRWLLLEKRWTDYPLSLSALVAQAQCNGGCWPFDKDERAVLEAEPGAAIALAYCPRAAIPVPEQALAGDHTWRVAAQYSARPYPTWRRVTAGAATTYPEMVAKLGPDPRCDLPVQADILIAGCGTGQEAASWSLKLPGARITAIDISAPSLAFAAERCAAGGIANVEFRQCDLRDVASLGRRFDAVICSGVLHHLADPERGWNALVKVLKPGGVMRLMVYSAYARLFVRYVHGLIADLRAQRPCDDVLRAARERLIHTYPAIASSADFHTMAGVQDLLFHAHEDPFDIDRVVAGLASLELDFLGFRLEPEATARYRRDHPEDIYQRDIDSWRALDRQNPHPAQGQLIWWCAKPFKGPV